jgi:hypothetical protein
MTYTKRNSEAGFPECLMMVPGDTQPLPDYVRSSMKSHNNAVTAFMKDRMGAMNDLRRCERAILALLAGFDQWIGSNPDASDGFGAEHVTYPMSVAIGNALNYELGRLDGGTLSGYVCDRLTGLGINPDTGEFLPETSEQVAP